MTERKPRQTKTPRQRAEERVDVLERAHGRLMAKRQNALDVVTDLDTQIAEVEKHLEHERAHPALTTTSTTDNQED